MDTINPPACINCTHLLAVRSNLTLENRLSAKCAHEKNRAGYDLVTGQTFYNMTCAALREITKPDFCGPSGSWFTLYIRPEYISPPSEKEVATRMKTGVKLLDLGM